VPPQRPVMRRLRGQHPAAAVQWLGVTAHVRLGLSLDGPLIVALPICGTCAGASDVEAEIEAALAGRWVESLAAARG
jgi:hypothetical protein